MRSLELWNTHNIEGHMLQLNLSQIRIQWTTIDMTLTQQESGINHEQLWVKLGQPSTRLEI
jgi:hypothetical protein